MLCEFLSQCSHYMIFEVEHGLIKNKELLVSEGKETRELPEWMSQLGITDVIVFKVSKEIIQLFSYLKIHLFVGIQINSPESIIEEYLCGNLRSDNGIINKILELNL